MRDKVYQITVNEAYLERVRDRLRFAITAQSQYAESKNNGTWDDPIALCLADDLFSAHQQFDDLLKAALKPVGED